MMRNQMEETSRVLELTSFGGVIMSQYVQESNNKIFPITILEEKSEKSELAYEKIYLNSGKNEGNTLYVTNFSSIFKLTEKMISLEKEFGHRLSESKGVINVLMSNYEDNFVSEIEREFIRLQENEIGEKPSLIVIDSWPADEDLGCLEETISDMQNYLNCEVIVITSNQLLN